MAHLPRLLLLPLLLFSACATRLGRVVEPVPADAAARGYVLLAHSLSLPRGPRPFDCGPEALGALLTFWGKPVDLETLTRLLCRPDRPGTFADDLVRQAQERGFQVTLQRGSIGMLKTSIDAGTPPILLVRTPSGGFHYFVIVGYSDREETAVALDYFEARRFLTYAELEEAWAPTGYETLVLRPGDASTEFELGALDEENGRWAEAIGHFRKALEREPKHVEAMIGLGNCLRQTGEREECRKTYEQALTLSSSHAVLLNNFADLLLEEAKDLPRAADLSERAVDRLKLEYEEMRAELKKEKDERRRTLLSREAEAAQIRLAYALGTLGEIRFRNGEADRAAMAWQGSLDAFPLTEPDLRARRMLDLARANRALGMGSVARDWFRKALAEAADPDLRTKIEEEQRALPSEK